MYIHHKWPNSALKSPYTAYQSQIGLPPSTLTSKNRGFYGIRIGWFNAILCQKMWFNGISSWWFKWWLIHVHPETKSRAGWKKCHVFTIWLFEPWTMMVSWDFSWDMFHVASPLLTPMGAIRRGWRPMDGIFRCHLWHLGASYLSIKIGFTLPGLP